MINQVLNQALHEGNSIPSSHLSRQNDQEIQMIYVCETVTVSACRKQLITIAR